MQLERAAVILTLAAFLAAPAWAAPRQPQEAGFFASADYGHANASGGPDVSANTWGLGLGGQLPWAQTGIHIQLDGAYSSASADGVPTVKTWNAGVEPYYAISQARFGVAIHYVGQQGGLGYTNDTLYSYGAYGEWFATPGITLSAKSATITGGSERGALIGGKITGYLLRDLALSGIVEYEKEDRDNFETDLTVHAEYLLSESLPVSVFAGYTLASPSGVGSTDVNLFFVGLKIYADGRTSRTLVDRQRHGTLGWLSSFGTVNF